MRKMIINQLRISFILLTAFTVITGLIYPIVVTGIGQLFFHDKVNGSLIEKNGKVIGSFFIGQSFTDPKYFWGRPSATNPFPYNGESSSGSNFGPANADFLALVKVRIATLQATGRGIPVDLVTASGSGLDPDISPLAAFYQMPRIAKARHLSELRVHQLIESLIQRRTFRILGEPRVNVLQLNLALDNLT